MTGMKMRSIGLLAVGLVVTGCGTAPEDRPLGKAYTKCMANVEKGMEGSDDFDPDDYARLGDEGRSLAIGSPEVTEEGDVGDASRRLNDTITAGTTACVLNELEGPDSVISKMESTTAMMGRQDDSWGDYEVAWSYHPDNGFDATFEEASD